jgi:hypothetical protein
MTRTLFAAGRIPARNATMHRVSALHTGYDNRVRVLFGDGANAPELGLEMDAETYRAIPYGTFATPATFRAIAAANNHRAVIECRPDFDDLYTPA